jgi:multisubunit Na+/H+ antiporter MnhB subunit
LSYQKEKEAIMKSVILTAAARLISAIVLVFAVYLLWRGHHAPGGGFIAALVAGAGFALIALAEGPQTLRRGLFILPQHLIGAGIGLAIGAGTVAMVHNKPFLTGFWWPHSRAIVGTPIFFDLAVFLVVIGSILTVLLALEEN